MFEQSFLRTSGLFLQPEQIQGWGHPCWNRESVDRTCSQATGDNPDCTSPELYAKGHPRPVPRDTALVVACPLFGASGRQPTKKVIESSN